MLKNKQPNQQTKTRTLMPTWHSSSWFSLHLAGLPLTARRRKASSTSQSPTLPLPHLHWNSTIIHRPHHQGFTFFRYLNLLIIAFFWNLLLHWFPYKFSFLVLSLPTPPPTVLSQLLLLVTFLLQTIKTLLFPQGADMDLFLFRF